MLQVVSNVLAGIGVSLWCAIALISFRESVRDRRSLRKRKPEETQRFAA